MSAIPRVPQDIVIGWGRRGCLLFQAEIGSLAPRSRDDRCPGRGWPGPEQKTLPPQARAPFPDPGFKQTARPPEELGQ